MDEKIRVVIDGEDTGVSLTRDQWEEFHTQTYGDAARDAMDALDRLRGDNTRYHARLGGWTCDYVDPFGGES